MQRKSLDRSLIAAILGTVAVFALLFVTRAHADPTPLLTPLHPVLTVPLALLGGGMGFWSASRITAVPAAARRPVARWIARLVLAGYAAYASVAAGERMFEAVSFRHGAVRQEASLHVVEKRRVSRRRAPTLYMVDVAFAPGGRTTAISLDQPLFDRIGLAGTCVEALIERSANGALRWIRPLRWGARCPPAQGR